MFSLEITREGNNVHDSTSPEDDFTNLCGYSHLDKTNADKQLTKKKHIKPCLIN